MLICCLSLCLNANGQAVQRKIRLTDADLLKSLPAGIVNTPERSGFRPAMPAGNKEKELVEGWVNPTWSPDSTKIAYTLNNDLYSIDVKTKEIIRHTFDGNDLILNGYASWVYYEEIFGRPSKYKAFWWSTDSKILAYYRFDNTNVPMFPIYLPDGQHGYLNQTRYPKAGDPNPKVKIGFVSANGGETVWSDFNQDDDQYFGTPFWNGEGTRLMVSWMDRAQDNLILYAVDPFTGSKQEVYREHQDSWIDWMDNMLFTEKGIYIVRDYELWQQIYYLTYDGKVFERLTDGGKNWSISLLKVDKNYLYYTAKREATVRTDIYRITLKNKKVERISYGDYNFAGVSISEDANKNTIVKAQVSNLSTPTKNVEIVIPKSGNLSAKKVNVLFDSKGDRFDFYAIAIPELVYYTTRDGYKIPATVIWPVDMDKSKKYPVKVNIYGGPDSPQVSDTWKGVSFRNQWWANHGVIQVTLDNRSGGHLGKAGLNQVYRNLTVRELEDFIDGIKYFTALPYVNADKVGIEGFSYGGTMTTLCVTAGSDYFKYGIAGGSVADWMLYDSHYTERYMDTPQDNPDGYKAGSVLNRMSPYKGDKTNMLRITNGTGDDNVHFQNTLKIVNELQQQCKDFELMIYPGGMHGYRGMQGMQSSLQDYVFWYKYLLDSELPQNLREYLVPKK